MKQGKIDESSFFFCDGALLRARYLGGGLLGRYNSLENWDKNGICLGGNDVAKVKNPFKTAKDGAIKLTNDGYLEIVFIDIGSAFATTMFQSNLFVVKGENHLAIDLGSKAAVALTRAGLSTLDIENLLLTHSHADHIGSVEEWCLKARYVAPFIRGCELGEYRPNLFTTKGYARVLWDGSLRGALQHSKEKKPGRRLSLSDYVTLHLGKRIKGYDRPTFHMVVGEGKDAIDIKVMRTHHIQDPTGEWQKMFYSLGVLIDDRVFVSGDTMFDRELIETYGAGAESIFHDCQDYSGGVHASYEELCTLPAELKEKTVLYHLPDGIRKKFRPKKDGFIGWARPYSEGSYIYK